MVGWYQEEKFFGVKRRVFNVNSLEDGLTAIQRGEEAVCLREIKINDVGANKVAQVLNNNRTLKLLE